MQDLIETKRAELARLKARLQATEAERDRIHSEVQALEASLTTSASTGWWNRATLATVSLLAVASLLSASVFHDAQSSVKQNSQSDAPVYSALETGQILRDERPSASSNRPSSRSDKKRTVHGGTKTASQLQWGPPLLMPELGANKGPSGFDPRVKEQQANLLTLGFDVGGADGYKGPRTRQALAEFRALYLPDNANQLEDADLGVIIENYANLARSDAAKFGIDHGIVAAIRLSSVRTGVNFSYLMKLAGTESNFKPESESATSSATGMYQFTRDTWLNVIKTYGPKYGLVGNYAENIDYYVTRSGYQRPLVRDKAMYEHLLELRKNPRLSAIMAAEMVRDNQQKLVYSFDREPTEADLYLTHFLGTDAAIDFLRSLEHNPEVLAVELFPKAASSNHDIFHPKTCEPRTVDEVYALFGQKLNNRRYDVFADN